MNGPLKLYRTKQIVRHDLHVELPDCMYKLKNIHSSGENVVDHHSPSYISSSPRKADIFDQNNRNIPEMAALEARQMQILQQLADLKKQMDSIRKNLNLTGTLQKTATTAPETCQGPPPSLPDVIINASPTHPPYSLQIIQKLWQNYVALIVKTHQHSSITCLDEKAAKFGRSLEQFAPENGAPKVTVRLIWKDVGANPVLILSHLPIVGEINILRYLSRVSFDALNYEKYPNFYEIDYLLDVAFNIVKAKTKTSRTKLLQILNKSLGKTQFLAGRNDISIADLAAYSAIKQVTNANELGVGLSKWLQRCELC